MVDGNPNDPQTSERYGLKTPPPTRRVLQLTGKFVLVIGGLILAYAAAAFWLFNELPPNDAIHGRLPSLYLMGAGIVIVVVGLIASDQRVNRRDKSPNEGSRKVIPTSYGIIGLVAILIILFFVISLL